MKPVAAFDPYQLPRTQLLIDGEWRAAAGGKAFDTINPATETVIAKVAQAEAADIDLAVAARGGPSKARGRK